MPLYSDSSNYYYSGGSSQLYSPYYSSGSGLGSSSSSSPSYTSSYNRAYPGSYMVPLLPSPRSPSAYSGSSSSGVGTGSCGSSSILGLSSRYQPKLTTITESSALTGRHSGHSSLMPLTRIQSPKYTSVSTYGTGSSSSSSSRYIPPRPIAINTADIDVSSARYRRKAEPVERRRDPEPAKEQLQQTKEAPREQQQPQQPQHQPEQQQQQQAQPRRSTIRRNRAVVRLSTIRRRSNDRAEQAPSEQQQQQQKQQEQHQFRDLPPAQEPSLSWRQKLAEELAAFPTTSNKKSPGELLRERFYIRDEKQEMEATPPRQRQQHQQQLQLQQPAQAKLTSPEISSEEESEQEQETQTDTEQLSDTIRRLSLVQCPTFHDICEDISSDKIDDDLNAGELRRRASIIQEQEQELLNKLQKSNSGSFQLIHLERRSSHDSTTADEAQSSTATKPVQKKSKKLRHKITAVVDVENAVVQHMPSVQELEELVSPAQNKQDRPVEQAVVSPKPKFTANVETIEEHHQIHKIFKLPKKKTAPQQQQSLPEGFMKAEPKAKTSPLKKPAKAKDEEQEQQPKQLEQKKQEQPKQKEKSQQEPQQQHPDKKLQEPQQHVSVAQIFTFDEASIEQSRATATPTAVPLKKEGAATPLPVKIEAIASPAAVPVKKEVIATPTAVPVKQEGVATPKPIRKALQKSESGEDFWSQIGSRETLYMSNRKKAQSERQLESTPETSEAAKEENAGTTTAAAATPETIATTKAATSATATPTTPKLRSEIVIELKPATVAAAPAKPTATTPKSTTAAATPATAKTTAISTKAEAIGKTAAAAEINPPKSAPATAKPTATTPKLITTTATAQVTPAATATKTEATAKVVSPKSTPATPKTATTTTLKLKTTTSVEAEAISPESTPATPKTTATSPKLSVDVDAAATVAAKISPKSTPATPKAITAKTQAAATVAGAAKQSGNAVVMTTASASAAIIQTTTITTTTTTTATAAEGKTKLIESAAAATTIAKTAAATAPKINAGQRAKSPEQQAAAAAAATAAAATKINKTHNNERQQQPLGNAAASAAAAAATATLSAKQQTETKSKLTETVEPKSKVQSPKTTKPKGAAAAAAKKKVAATPTTAAAAAAAAAAATTLPDSNVTPINADQFITLAPTKAANAAAAATNASSPATATAATAATATATAVTTPTTTAVAATTAAETIATTGDEQKSQLRSVADAAAVAAAAAAAVDSGNNSCGEGVGNNLSKFATVSNLAQCLRDVDAELEDYIPSSAEDSEFSDSDSSDDLSSANLSASMKKKQRKEKKKQKAKEAAPARFDPQKKIKIDTTSKCYVKEEAPRYPLVATPRPLWKREKIVYSDENTDDESSEEGSEATAGSLEEDSDEDDSDACSSSSSNSSSSDFDEEAGRNTEKRIPNAASTSASNTLLPVSSSTSASATASGSASVSSSPSIIRMSTCSNDSGFEGGTAPSSPKKMLECDVNCHKKCERLTANLCGVNQKLIVEALNHVKRGAREARDSPSTPPSCNPAYKIDPNDEHDVIPRFKNYSVDDFHFLAVLGKGSFGKVLLAELRDTTYYYAIKCLKKDVVLEDDDVDSTLIERKVLALGTKHPYLCHLFCTFQTESHLFFVMEYLNGGDLMFHIQESGRFSEERARFYGAEIISGLKFLHKKGIIYRDLKLDNVLLDYEGHVRIADFGMCKLQIYLDKTADSFCGTPDYMAPEIIKGEKYNQNVDWWSFGVLLYEMLIGQSPFSGCDEDELFWSICNEIPWFPVYISAEATGILKGLLEKDYTKRIGSQYSPAGDIADHIFFRPIDWNLLEKRQIEPPFKPQVKHPLDTQYFDRVFTRERVRLTPIDKEILASMDQKQFHGFTYTNPHITLD